MRLLKNLATWLVTLLSGKPHFVVGGDDPYLLRWHLIPRNPLLGIYLHKFLRDDDDRALHDHPWSSVSICLAGGYWEQTDAGEKWFGPGSIVRRAATYRHRIIVSKSNRSAWTLFITGPRVRTWGFWCPRGFVPWYDFVDQTDHGNIGRGCD